MSVVVHAGGGARPPVPLNVGTLRQRESEQRLHLLERQDDGRRVAMFQVGGKRLVLGRNRLRSLQRACRGLALGNRRRSAPPCRYPLEQCCDGHLSSRLMRRTWPSSEVPVQVSTVASITHFPRSSSYPTLPPAPARPLFPTEQRPEDLAAARLASGHRRACDCPQVNSAISMIRRHWQRIAFLSPDPSAYSLSAVSSHQSLDEKGIRHEHRRPRRRDACAASHSRRLRAWCVDRRAAGLDGWPPVPFSKRPHRSELDGRRNDRRTSEGRWRSVESTSQGRCAAAGERSSHG